MVDLVRFCLLYNFKQKKTVFESHPTLRKILLLNINFEISFSAFEIKMIALKTMNIESNPSLWRINC